MQINYKRFLETRLKLVNKSGEVVPFALNKVQETLLQSFPDRLLLLKARQMGMSSLILAMFTADFILKDNTVNVVVADIADNAEALLDRVKFFLRSYEELTGVKVPLKYNSKYELQNSLNGSKYSIGTAKNTEFGRSRTITNLHLSEAAFYPNMEKLLAGALQAVVPNGRVILETTANGFNSFKDYWDRTTAGETGFTAIFYGAEELYDAEFLSKKRLELGRLYKQEYPETAIEAFITSGQCYFDTESLSYYLQNAKEPISREL